ncbi:MAG: S8 family serine peptidase, partial [Anaerolineae bacterium]
ERSLDRYQATLVRPLYGSDVELWQVPEGDELALVGQLSADPRIEYAEPNYRYWAFDTKPNDPSFSKQWAHVRMNSPKAWDLSTGSATTVIAIIDSGIDAGHPDLAGKLVAGRDFVDDDTDPRDLHGHGTHVAGIAAALTNNNVGVAGMDWNAKILPVRVLDAEGGGYSSDIIDGINWATSQGAKILNLSLGGPSYSAAMQNAVNSAHAAGRLVVAAMGNENVSTPMYPAALAYVMAVSATGPTDSITSYSNYGNHCDIAAPGGDMSAYHDPDGIYSTMPTYSVYLNTDFLYYTQYDYVHGTSQAAPYVSGLAALIWTQNPGLTPDEVQDIIEATAVDLGASGWDPIYGYGRIVAAAALQTEAPPSTPELLTIDNADGDGSYVVDWSTVPNATSYTLQEDDDPAFSSPVVRYQGASNQATVTGQVGGTWYYRVRASNTYGPSDWSTVRSVGVKPAAPTLEAIDNPSSEDAYDLVWSPVDGASEYTLEEADNASFTGATVRYKGTLLAYPVTGQSGGTWYYRVRASNLVGDSPWSGDQSTTVTPSALNAPSFDPIENDDGDGEYTITWSDVVSATSYLLEESHEPYFVAPAEVYSGTVSAYTATQQTSGHWYYRVRAVGPLDKSPWSEPEDVIVKTRVFLPSVRRSFPLPVSVGLPIEEGFEGGTMPPSGWTQIIQNGSYITTTWGLARSSPFEGEQYATVYYDPELGTQNELLLSPEFEATSATLDFYSYGSLYWCRDGEFDNCDLNVWLVLGAWDGVDDVPIYTADQDWPADWQWGHSVVDLSPHLASGAPVRVAFQYIGQDGAQVALDAVRIVAR